MSEQTAVDAVDVKLAGAILRDLVSHLAHQMQHGAPVSPNTIAELRRVLLVLGEES
jgi:hypothetical protein